MHKDDLNCIKEEVYKCSKCGLCQCVCPIYLATKNEIYLPRGKYNILNNFFNNKKKLSSAFIKNLDICLNCNECTNFCPSSINAEEIFTELKHYFHFKQGIVPFFWIYFINLHIHKIKSIFTKENLYKVTIKRKKQKKTDKIKKRVVYFEGCFNKYINPTDKNAVLNIIEKLNYEVIKINTNCCGLPFLSGGNPVYFKKNSEKIINSIPSDIDYIICSCDSCYKTLKKAFKNNILLDKLILFDNLLKINNFAVPECKNAVIHKTLGRIEEYYFPASINIINKKGSCSLMENYFMMKHKELAKTLIKTVFYKKEEINNKTIITTCQLAKQGILYGIQEINSNTKVVSYAEYIEENC